jgi:hypothetical protein
MTLHERVQEFVAVHGHQHLLPFLNRADKDKVSRVCSAWQRMVNSELIFKKIVHCAKDTASAIKEIEETKE